jgi:adenylate kinase
MRLVFLGSPGVGKGTQAKRLSQEYHVPHIATGDMLRAAISKGTPVGQEAKSYVDSGGLVPDDVVIRIVEARLGEDDMKGGFILDGFPRTKEQAEALAKMGGQSLIDRVVYFDLGEEEQVLRLSGRMSCPKCSEIYHTVNRPPKQDGVCDGCGAALIRRKDDQPEAVIERLRVYQNQTAPLIQYYEDRGMLSKVDAHGSVEEVACRVKQAGQIR